MSNKTCTFNDCGRPKFSLGWCVTHWREHKRTGNNPVKVLPAYLGQKSVCSFSECNNWVKRDGLCGSHARQVSNGKTLAPLTVKYSRTARNDDGNKRCRRCESWLPESEFYSDSRASDGLNTYCKPCTRVMSIETRYNLPYSTYEKLLADQGGVCAICASEPLDGTNLNIDHDHSCCSGMNKSCGKCVRGLLCSDCNTALGLMNDDASRLMKAINYLNASSN
jgi:hypothetical protein